MKKNFKLYYFKESHALLKFLCKEPGFVFMTAKCLYLTKKKLKTFPHTIQKLLKSCLYWVCRNLKKDKCT